MDNGLIHSARLEQHLLDVAEPVVLEIFQVRRSPEKLQVRVQATVPAGGVAGPRAISKRKTYLRNLAKLVFVKACENSYLRNLANLAKQT